VHADAGRLVVETGAAAGAFTVALAPDRFSDWAQDVSSLNGLVLAGTATTRNGSAREVGLWDSLWRCLLEGWPVVGAIEFRDRRGEPLDLGRVFSPDDDPDELAHHLREAGFARLRGWVSPEEAAAIGREMDEALPHYTEGDGRSWWARLDDGSVRCVRMQQFVDRSPTAKAFYDGSRWDDLRRIFEGDDDLVQGRPGNQVAEALVKPVGVVAGASDLSLHRDCHLGGHAFGCSGVDLGITITASGRGNGQLGVIAGSHRLAIPGELATSTSYLPHVAVETDAGDCTVHLSCTLHESTAPTRSTRKVMYAPFKLEPPPGEEPAPERGPELRDEVYKMLLEDDLS
jgi:hypothetical protein